jgi:hypothetical protein
MQTKGVFMLRAIICSMFVVSTLAMTTAVANDRDDDRSRRGRLKGEYAFTGSAACFYSVPSVDPVIGGGFDSDLRPNVGSRVFHHSFSVEGVRKFRGDGTGTVNGTTVGFTPPPTPGAPPPFDQPGDFPPSAQGATFSFSFTYTVLPDGTFTSDIVPGSFTGTFFAGPRTGQTFAIDTMPLTGLIGVDKKVLTIASVLPTVETATYSNGDVWPRICHRSRVLVRMDD